MEQVKKPWLKFCGCVPESLKYPDCTMAEAVEAIARESRRYAKRQRTWFRRNPEIHWIVQADPPVFSAVLDDAAQYLSNLGWIAQNPR